MTEKLEDKIYKFAIKKTMDAILFGKADVTKEEIRELIKDE